MKYTVKVTFYVEVEADNEEEAENICQNWTPRHPQDKGKLQMGEKISPDTVRIK